MIRNLAIFMTLGLSACSASYGPNSTARAPQIFPPGQGQYVYPDYLRPAVTPMLPPVDACRSQLFQGLVGQPEGAIFIPGLPGRKRVLKPSFDEGFQYEPDETFGQPPTLMEIRDYLPGQSLYAPSIRDTRDLLALEPVERERLTIELDQFGIVQEIRCG